MRAPGLCLSESVLSGLWTARALVFAAPLLLSAYSRLSEAPNASQVRELRARGAGASATWTLVCSQGKTKYVAGPFVPHTRLEQALVEQR